MTKEEEKRPMISVEAVYPGDGDHRLVVDEAMLLEAFPIASALMTWTLKNGGILHKLIDYVKISFSQNFSANKTPNVIFKLTIRLPDDPARVFEIVWSKCDGILHGNEPIRQIARCFSKDEVANGIKSLLYSFVAHLGKTKIKDGQRLESLSQAIKGSCWIETREIAG